ncbi:hypothetical protein BD779DRAFT_1706243 [Infundibulicybe gibba]|nr:hypothetical protein BD779DRAFT_1706243 [Infundibulicybe gibba]
MSVCRVQSGDALEEAPRRPTTTLRNVFKLEQERGQQWCKSYGSSKARKALPSTHSTSSRHIRFAISFDFNFNKPSTFHGDDYMCGAHGFLALSCAKNMDDKEAGWYAKQYWSDHLRRAKSSEQLFETLSNPMARGKFQVPISPITESPNTPTDILARWHTARADWVFRGSLVKVDQEKERSCLLDQVFEERLRLRMKTHKK